MKTARFPGLIYPLLVCLADAAGSGLVPVTTPVVYSDGRPYPYYRMPATDHGKFLDFGGAPNQSDSLGIREALINQVDGKFYQIENSSIYYEPANQTWFLFTNHIGIAGEGEFTDAIWVYWTKDLNVWNSAHKAVVLDGSNCSWSRRCIGMPSVTVVGDNLHIFYDAPGGDSISHMHRSLGMATLQLPLDPTVPACIPTS